MLLNLSQIRREFRIDYVEPAKHGVYQLVERHFARFACARRQHGLDHDTFLTNSDAQEISPNLHLLLSSGTKGSDVFKEFFRDSASPARSQIVLQPQTYIGIPVIGRAHVPTVRALDVEWNHR